MARRCVLVIGMHRSGTSLTMQALEALGAEHGGDLLAADEFNARGYFEPAEIVQIHDGIFADLGRSWGRPEHLLPIPAEWWDGPQAKSAEKRIAKVLKQRLARIGADSVLALKDPRMSLLLPLWLRVARRLEIDLRLILCLRHPVAVARSLAARDRIAAPMAEALWLAYTTAALADSGGLPLHLSRHDDWLTRPADCLAAIARFIGAPPPPADVLPFAPELTHHRTQETPADPLVARCWEEWHALPLAEPVPRTLIRRAQEDIRVRRHMAVLAQAIRAEVGETPSYLLDRELGALRQGLQERQAAYEQEARSAAALRERAEGLLAAYQAEAQTSAGLRDALSRREVELAENAGRAAEWLEAYQKQAAETQALRAALDQAEAALRDHVVRLDDLQTAYHAEAATSTALREGLAGCETELAALMARAEELLTAYRTEAETSAALREGLAGREAEVAALLVRAEELLAAYQAEAATSADLRDAYLAEHERAQGLARKLARFNPLTWLPFPSDRQ